MRSRSSLGNTVQYRTHKFHVRAVTWNSTMSLSRFGADKMLQRIVGTPKFERSTYGMNADNFTQNAQGDHRTFERSTSPELATEYVAVLVAFGGTTNHGMVSITKLQLFCHLQHTTHYYKVYCKILVCNECLT